MIKLDGVDVGDREIINILNFQITHFIVQLYLQSCIGGTYLRKPSRSRMTQQQNVRILRCIIISLFEYIFCPLQFLIIFLPW